jgi:hypothetical protein
MSESAVAKVAQVSQVKETIKVEPGQTMIRGKVSSRTRIGKLYIQIISAPAPDEYSYPKAYEVSSREPLGEVDDRVTALCEVTGRRVQKSWTNPETGEVKKFPGAYIGLRAVENES